MKECSIEIKIPKEVRDYHENIFFGLNTRQFICSVLAVGVAVGIYFALQPYVATEEIGWMCILGAAPFAACGFFTYHGMTAEQVLWTWVKSEILCPKRLVFKSDSYYYEARSYFARVGTDLVTHLAQLSSVANELALTERLHIFRDFFKAGEQAAAEFNIHKHAKRGQHFKDWFCPDSMEFAADHFRLDARYGRVLYLQDYASYNKDSFVSELCDLDRDLMLSIDILLVPTDEAARQLLWSCSARKPKKCWTT